MVFSRGGLPQASWRVASLPPRQQDGLPLVLNSLRTTGHRPLPRAACRPRPVFAASARTPLLRGPRGPACQSRGPFRLLPALCADGPSCVPWSAPRGLGTRSVAPSALRARGRRAQDHGAARAGVVSLRAPG